MQYGGDRIHLAYNAFESSNSERPSEEDIRLADYLVSRARRYPDRVVPLVCKAAMRWCDDKLWCRAVSSYPWKQCDELTALENVIKDAMAVFEFDKLREGYVHHDFVHPDGVHFPSFVLASPPCSMPLRPLAHNFRSSQMCRAGQMSPGEPRNSISGDELKIKQLGKI